VQLDDGGSYHPSDTQRWLWDGWLKFIEWAKDVSQGYKPIAVFDGDLGELDTKKRSNQMVTMNKATILNMITEALEPLTQYADDLYFIRGTPAHVGKSSWLEEVAADYDNTIYYSKGIRSHYQVRLSCDRVRVDIAHHGSMGNTFWTEKNSANKCASEAMTDYAFKMGQLIPHLIIRGHNHRWADSFDNYTTRAAYLPCWSGGTEYLHRLGKYNGTADVGGIVILCENGQYEVEKFRHKPRKVNVWQSRTIKY
jgi:hypothetical protein